jgi:hypothetical protein
MALVAGAAVIALCGCSAIRRTLHADAHSTARSEQLQALQLRSMRFADEYVGAIIEPIRHFQSSTDNSVDRLMAQNWVLSQATAAYTIASGPSPVVNAVDMVVLTTLSRMVIDDAWSSERFGDRAALLRNAYHRLERTSLELAKSVFSADQIAELQRVILEWRARNPHTTAISSVHFRDVATSIGTPTSGGIDSFSGLFSFLGLDPFSSLDPAVREIALSRELAERTIYYAQRLPNLLDMQVERLTYEFATMPETTRLLGNADSIAGAAAATGRVVDDLPKLLAREREAAIRQFMDALTLETAHTRQLVDQLRGALEAGTETSQSVTTSIRAFDQLMGRFDKTRAGGGAEPSSGRPFNITEYTAAAAEITRAAHELEGLIGDVNRARPALAQAAEHVSITLQDAIDRVFWRALELIMLLILTVLTAALTYRGITQRRARVGSTPMDQAPFP